MTAAFVSDKRQNGIAAVLLTALVLLGAGQSGAAEQVLPAGVIELDETVISGNQELPKVLYIVPWQQPEGLPDIELEAAFTEADLFRRLYPPAYRRELGYYQAATAPDDSNVSDSEE